MTTVFYPRDIGMWRTDHDAEGMPKVGPPVEFGNRKEFVEWITTQIPHDDKFPLRVSNKEMHWRGKYDEEVFPVITWTTIGWVSGQKKKVDKETRSKLGFSRIGTNNV